MLYSRRLFEVQTKEDQDIPALADMHVLTLPAAAEAAEDAFADVPWL